MATLSSDPWRWSACDAVAALQRRDISPLELIDAALARIEAVEPGLNALPILCADRARDHAKTLGVAPAEARAWLAGLPIAIKDLHDVAGVRTTQGSPIFADRVPDHSAPQVERLEANGAIVLAKSNTPEFGAGAQTFNEVFGATRNPWNAALTCGGSSGGAATALAAGAVWLADGSDLGGSLRTPAAFCGVVGLRPSPGLVAGGGRPIRAQNLSVLGPMARSVRDVALGLDAMVGLDPRDPMSFAPPDALYLDAARAPRTPLRVAWSPDLGGLTPVDAEVVRVCARAVAVFEEMGVEIVEAAPDFAGAIGAFTTLRAADFAASLAPLLASHRALLKPEVVWNIEKGLALDADAIGAAERRRADMRASAIALLEDVDLLLCPAAIVEPFPVEERYVAELNGRRFDTYVDWLGVSSAITMTGLPALSLPAGLTARGLPVGLQMVGRARGEAALLRAAAALEDALDMARRVPIEPRSGR